MKAWLRDLKRRFVCWLVGGNDHEPAYLRHDLDMLIDVLQAGQIINLNPQKRIDVYPFLRTSDQHYGEVTDRLNQLTKRMIELEQLSAAVFNLGQAINTTEYKRQRDTDCLKESIQEIWVKLDSIAGRP